MSSTAPDNATPLRSGSGYKATAALIVLLLISLLLRLPYLSHNIFQGDPVNYAWGALIGGVAHPPGYVGYCMLGRAVNWIVGNINRSFVLINLTMALGAIAACYAVARQLGMGVRAALLTAATLSFSINMLYISVTAVNHASDALFATVFAWFSLRAIQTRSLAPSLGATAVIALAGALRPTTTMFCALLWLYMIFKSTRKPSWIALHLLIGVPIVLAWSWTNKYFMEKHGFGSTYAVQVMMPSTYDYVNLGTGTATTLPIQPTYHMPAFEMLGWLESKLGFRLLPHADNWPTPSLRRAVRLSVIQAAKLAYNIVFSAPIVALFGLLLVLRRRLLFRPPGWMVLFFVGWLTPAILFFIFGHLGALGYVMCVLPGIILLCCYCLLGPESGATDTPTPAGWRQALVMAPIVLSLAFFMIGRPFQAREGMRRMGDLLFLQYTGNSIRAGFATARVSSAAEDLAQVAPQVRACRSDEELIVVFRELNYQPSPVLKRPQAQRP